jgi:hypothetical protein
MTASRITLIVIAAVFLGGTAWVYYTLGRWLGTWQHPIRPPGASQSAHYVSTGEEATWFDCWVDTRRDVDVCRAWDTHGRLIANGDYRLEDEDRAATATELRPSLVSGRGGKAQIYLFGPNHAIFGRVLLPFVDGRRIGVPKVTTNP